ncbi:sensor histidine kinase [Parapedobacter defluvii]|uniref:sensor histidine kinase n=1 Tax=Parapedobacter defluvii TaxID=2045106 RepID=UPI00333E354F
MRKVHHIECLRRATLGLLLGLWIFSTHPLTAQETAERYADSLLNSALTASTNELKIEGLLKVSIFWSDRDTTKAYRYLEMARQQMGKSPSDFQMGLYRLYRANILMEYDRKKAKAEYLAADSLLATSTTPKSYRYRSNLWNNYGVILQKEDQDAAFMEIIVNKTLPYARLAGDSAAVGYQLQNMGLLLGNVQNHQKAVSYYEQALKTIRDLPGKEENKLEIFTNTAKNELYLRNFDRARRHLDSAQHYIRMIPHSTYIPTFYRTELIYFRQIKDTDKALQSYRNGIAAAQKLGDEYMLMDINFELHALYRDLGEYRTAKKYLSMSNAHRPFHSLKNSALYHHEMAKLDYQLKNYQEAYLHMDSLRTVLDSIYEKDATTKVLNLEKQYKTAENENRILRLEAENRQQELAIAKSHWWGLALGAGLLLALCIAFFSWKINKKNKKMFAQKEQLHQEDLRSIHQQERLGQYDAMLRGQEAERNRLARDLHDGLGGLLAGVKLKLSSIVTKEGEKLPNGTGAVHEVIHQLDYSLDELRRIAHNMMPEALRNGGLVPALSDLCRYMDTPQIPIKFQSLNLEDNYPEQLRITVYRIVQELLANALKHANASEIILQCSELDRWLFITVEDNGKGMATAENVPSKGLGLSNIRNRVALLNGQMEIQAQPGEGTTVNIQIPL